MIIKGKTPDGRQIMQTHGGTKTETHAEKHAREKAERTMTIEAETINAPPTEPGWYLARWKDVPEQEFVQVLRTPLWGLLAYRVGYSGLMALEPFTWIARVFLP